MSGEPLPTYLLAGGATSDRTPILFLHGLGGNAMSFSQQLTTVATEYPCVSWTMPGYDDSPPLDEVTWPALADAAVRLLDHLDIAKAVVVGHSLGGMIAQRLVIDHPDRVEKLVLVQTSSAFGKPGSDFNREFLAARLQPLDEGRSPADFAEEVARDITAPGASDETIGWAIMSMSRISADAYRAALECLVTFDLRDQLGRIQVPTLLISGSEDTTAPARVMAKMAEQIPDAQHVCIDGVGHLANVEDPPAFDAALRAFLA